MRVSPSALETENEWSPIAGAGSRVKGREVTVDNAAAAEEGGGRGEAAAEELCVDTISV